MEWFVVAACMAMNFGTGQAMSTDECMSSLQSYQQSISATQLSQEDREAITRVAFAEAGNQGTSGIAGVVYTILNRHKNGKFGNSISDVLNARNQFEPVTKVGGWENLPPATAEEKATVNAILNLALEGRLPDLTKGALFFQNPAIVQQRADAGAVDASLVNFGGKAPSAIIKDHAFYTDTKKAAPVKPRPVSAQSEDELAAASPILFEIPGAVGKE